MRQRSGFLLILSSLFLSLPFTIFGEGRSKSEEERSIFLHPFIFYLEGFLMSSPLQDKSKAFALSIIRLCNEIRASRRETVLTNQLLRSGTSVDRKSVV